MRKTASLSVLVSTMCSLGTAVAQPAAPLPGPTVVDVTPLLESLRPAERATVARAARVSSLDQLPYYDLNLAIDDNGRGFSLREEVVFTNTERAPMPELVFRVYGNATRPSTIHHGPPPPVPVVMLRGQCVGATCTVRNDTVSVFTVRPSAPIAPGGRLRVQLELRGTLPEIDPSRTNIMAQGMESLSMLGANESSGDYGLLAHGDGVTSLANFFPVLGRRTGTRWERTDSGHVGDLGSDDLANVHASIEVASGTVVATTGIALPTSLRGATPAPTGPGRRRIEVGAAAVRDFAVMAGPTLQIASRRVGDVEVRSFFLPEHRAAGERVLDTAASALAVYERRFGPYPYVDLDVVEAPLVGGAGGVEFPGLVTVASMFYRPATEGGGGLLGMLGGGDALARMLPGMIEFVTAHEIAHQFWHALVGSDSREHPFIDESLAQWSAALYLEDRYGPARARADGDMNVRMNYQFMRMLGQGDGAVDRPTSAFASPMAYAGLVYGKGPYLYNALREAAGDEAFFRAARRYVDTWRFRTAPPTGFVDAVVAESPRNAARYRALADRWLRQSHGDEDLGEMDMNALVGSVLGQNHGAVDPEVQQALQGLAPLLQGMLQGQRGNTPNRPGGPAPGRAGQAQPAPQLDGIENLLRDALQGAGER